MDELNLESVHGRPRYVPAGQKFAHSNHAKIENLLNRNFSGWNEKEVVSSDLTYVRVGGKWHCVCTLVDLFNREVVGWSVGENKTSDLVLAAFSRSGIDCRKVKIIHTDRGSEFCSAKIDEFLARNGINRSLSRPGRPIDNAVSESLFRTLKVEFVRKRDFGTLKRLSLQLGDWVHWYNHLRLHSALNNLSPISYRKRMVA